MKKIHKIYSLYSQLVPPAALYLFFKIYCIDFISKKNKKIKTKFNQHNFPVINQLISF